VHGLVIGRLAGGEAGFVDAIVDVRIDPRVDLIDPRSRSSSGLKSSVLPVIPSKAELNIRMISALSFETMRPVSVSQRTGTVTRVVTLGSARW
jgi:hypothetical protein